MAAIYPILLCILSCVYALPLFPRALEWGVTLRMLPLGDSITWGYLSSDGNGYRLDLENLLDGNPVEYIGSQQSGNMADNWNEGCVRAIRTGCLQ
ncbi:hypothetical protein LTR56_025386, partial [Elasticomyces elasticus]